MPEFACEILTPYRRFYNGRAESVTFVTHDGQIEILANHESLVAPVRVGQLRLVVGGKVRRAAITEGFARVKGGRIDLFVDAAEWPEEIDRERAERALGRATKRLATETLAWRIEASRHAAARAQNRLAVVAGEPSPTFSGFGSELGS
jgi:F-type H+-transporting ATPase subunit epsilon